MMVIIMRMMIKYMMAYGDANKRIYLIVVDNSNYDCDNRNVDINYYDDDFV